MSGSHQFVRVWDRTIGSRLRRSLAAAGVLAVVVSPAASGSTPAAADGPADRVELVIPVAGGTSADDPTAPAATETSAPADPRSDRANAPPPAAIPFPSAIQLFLPGAALAAYAVHRIRRHRRWGVTR
jgi:hypothetical protein